MLRSINGQQNTEPATITVGEANYPSPFSEKLQFNAPAHGVWNIVHTGMLIPDSHQIYVCAPNCMRGVVLTAAEMNAMDRFSQVIIEEKDVIAGSIEQLTVDGVCDCLNKLPSLPKVALIFTVCVHHFVGSDLDWIYGQLAARFPDVCFVRCYMDPIMRKSGPAPDVNMRKSLYDVLTAMPENPKCISVLGGDFALDEECDLKVLLRKNGYRVRELPACDTFDEYMAMAEASLFISCYPNAIYGAEALAARLKRPHLNLPMSFGFTEIRQNELKLCNALGLEPPDFGEREEKCEVALAELKKRVGDMPVHIDYTLHPRPLGLARLLLERGFNVKCVYVDVVSGEEERDFYYLKQHFPSLLLASTTDPTCRIFHDTEPDALALGQKAAFFTGSRHFVNVVEGAGWYGYDGIIKFARAATDALDAEKDPREYISLKGLGCECCL